MSMPIIGFVGLTHLGLVSAVAAAEKGFSIVCVDTDANLVERLRLGAAPISEPGFTDLLARNQDRLSFSADGKSLKTCDVVYVAPDVATDDEGRSDLETVDALLGLTLCVARDDATIVILSQVPPGFSRARRPAKRALFYQVETLIFGNAVERALNPERIIVGMEQTGTPLPGSFRTILESFECPLLFMRYESAELAKISINCCLAASISATNMLAELCEKIGADWSEIAPALKLDRRIGPHAYLTPGLGIAGGNLERDLESVRRMAKEHASDSDVVSAWLQNSAHRKEWAFRTLRAKLLEANPDARVAVLGLAYKENTDSVKNSPSLALIARLSQVKLTVYDPVVKETMSLNAVMANDMMSAVRGADAVAIMTPWEKFRGLDPQLLSETMAGRLVLDPYRVLHRGSAIAAGLDYTTLGISDQSP